MPCRQIGIHAHADRRPQSLSLDGGCHHDELNPTVLKVILVSCATVAAGMCHSQMRHFEGICSLAGVEFFFACGGLGVVETTTVDVVRVCVMRVRVRQFLRVCTKPLLYTPPLPTESSAVLAKQETAFSLVVCHAAFCCLARWQLARDLSMQLMT